MKYFYIQQMYNEIFFIMRKLFLLVALLLFSACSGTTRYFVFLMVDNETGYDIEIFKNDIFYITIKNEESIILASNQCLSPNVEDINIEQIFLQTNKISFWTIKDNQMTLSKEWTYEERNSSGKQLFRLSDYIQEEKIYDAEWRGESFQYNYSITIYKEDLQ